MDDITIDEFPSDRLAAIIHWRNDPAVNRYLRQGIRTLDEVQEWYIQCFSKTISRLGGALKKWASNMKAH